MGAVLSFLTALLAAGLAASSVFLIVERTDLEYLKNLLDLHPGDLTTGTGPTGPSGFTGPAGPIGVAVGDLAAAYTALWPSEDAEPTPFIVPAIPAIPGGFTGAASMLIGMPSAAGRALTSDPAILTPGDDNVTYPYFSFQAPVYPPEGFLVTVNANCSLVFNNERDIPGPASVVVALVFGDSNPNSPGHIIGDTATRCRFPILPGERLVQNFSINGMVHVFSPSQRYFNLILAGADKETPSAAWGNCTIHSVNINGSVRRGPPLEP